MHSIRPPVAPRLPPVTPRSPERPNNIRRCTDGAANSPSHLQNDCAKQSARLCMNTATNKLSKFQTDHTAAAVACFLLSIFSLMCLVLSSNMFESCLQRFRWNLQKKYAQHYFSFCQTHRVKCVFKPLSGLLFFSDLGEVFSG